MRQDIQFLRGYAVAIVMLAHAGFGPSAGYLGVDIFFVISGYLITRLVQTQLKEGRFSFREFYLRRAKRLLPAAFSVFFVTSVAAPFFLTSLELNSYWQQLAGAVTFTANLVLAGQSGYFDSAAELKPLLHIWSLSLEEQYYLILPLLLLVVRIRFWPHLAAAILTASAAFCAYVMTINPDLAFFLLPTRAWELSAGALVSLMRLDSPSPLPVFRMTFWPALACIFIIPFFPTGLPHPSVDAALVCASTAIIIINGRQFFGRIYPLRATAWVGDASYSLYLAHWPVLAFTTSAYLGTPPLAARMAAIAIGVAIGFAIHYMVERPIHRSLMQPRIWPAIGLAAAASCLAFSPAVVALLGTSKAIDFAALRAGNYGLGIACDQRTEDFSLAEQCITVHPPTAAVWGDSFAMHLVQGLLADGDPGLVQLTRSSCPPVFGYAQFNNATKFTEEWAHSCVKFNSHVLNYLQNTPSIKTVILGSTFVAFTTTPPWRVVLYGQGRNYRVVETSHNIAVRALTNAVKSLQSIGKRVVIFAPPPASGEDFASCVERVAIGLVTLGVSDCTFTVARDTARYRDELAIIKNVSRNTGAQIIDPRPWLCDAVRCVTIEKGIPLYRDPIHLSAAGSRLLGKQHHWSRLAGILTKDQNL